MPGEASSDTAGYTQPCHFNTKGGVCLWVLLGQLWDTPVWGAGGDSLLMPGSTLFFML